MAVSFYTPQFSGDTCYTSQLQELRILTSAARVNLYVYRQAQIYYSGNGRTLIFQTEYYTHQSRANVYDLGSLIETYMAQNGFSIEQIILSANDGTDSAELTLKVLYCKQTPTIEAATLLADHFLTTSLTRLTYPNATELLPYFAGFGSQSGYITRNVHYYGTYLNPNGTTGICDAIIYGRTGYGLQTIDASYRNAISALRSYMPEGAKLVAYRVEYNNRVARFYVSEQTADLRQFVFRNIFGCREYLTLPTAQTTKTVSKSSTAVCGDTQTQYDITHSRTYEEQTPVLPLNEALHFAEFLTSYKVCILVDGVEHPILITDYTHEVSDNPGEGNAIKFEWQFASLRHPITGIDYSRIFSTQYKEPFV